MNVTEESASKKHLVIARVGDSSLHPAWLEPQQFLSFDLCLSYYGEQPGRYASHCVFYRESKGEKWQDIYQIIESLGQDIDRYQAIWIPDESISTNAYTINRMFHIFTDQELWLAHPALASGSYSLWPVLLQHQEYILRYTRLRYLAAPLFSSDALRDCLPLMNAGQSGRELAWVWPEEREYPGRKIAVIDATPVRLRDTESSAAAEAAAKEMKLPPPEEKAKEAPAAEGSAGAAGTEAAETPLPPPSVEPALDWEAPPQEVWSGSEPVKRSGRIRRRKKKTGLKHRIEKQRKTKKAKKPKLVRKLKQSRQVRVKKPLRAGKTALLKRKRSIPAARKKRYAA